MAYLELHGRVKSKDLALGDPSRYYPNTSLSLVDPITGNANLDIGSTYTGSLPPALSILGLMPALSASIELARPVDLSVNATLPAIQAEASIWYETTVFRGLSNSYKASWDESIRISKGVNVEVAQARKLRRTVILSASKALKIRLISVVSWSKATKISDKKSISWDRAESISKGLEINWGIADRIRKEYSLGWGSGLRREKWSLVAWGKALRSRNGETVVSWDKAAKRNLSTEIRWGKASRISEMYEGIIWDKARRPLWGVVPDEIIDPEIPHGGFTVDSDLDLMCPMSARPREYRRNLLALGDKPCMGLFAPNENVITNMAQSTLTRISDGLDVPFLSANISCDFGSMMWRFNAVLPENSLALVKKNQSGRVGLILNINGYKFLVEVNGWTKSRELGRKSWSISGKSLSSRMSKSDIVSSRVVTTSKTANQIANDELQNTGWTLQWDCIDWLIPSNTFFYENKSPLAVISEIAATVGAKVQTVIGDQKVIRVVPRYSVSPWSWASITPDIEMRNLQGDSIIFDSSISYEERGVFNHVFITGQNGGVSCSVKRKGTAGDKTKGIIVDRLITKEAAGTERGRQELSNTGDWETHSFRTVLSASYPPLVPSTMIKYVGTETWIGQSKAVSITADRSSGASKVFQTVEVERYDG